MKTLNYDEALINSITVFDKARNKIGWLVPVGSWILFDEKKISSIALWRQRSMRMFLAQFISTEDRTREYLKNYSINKADRLFFLIIDKEKRHVGHIGISECTSKSAELDNLMRGVNGGDPQLILYAELALLDWCFKELNLSELDVRILSYNWMVKALHEDVGFILERSSPLMKVVNDEFVDHIEVSSENSNVNYSCLRLKITNDSFYKKIRGS